MVLVLHGSSYCANLTGILLTSFSLILYPEEIAKLGEIHEEGDAAAFYLQLLPATQTAAFRLLVFHGTSLTLVASSHHKPARPSGLSSILPYTHLTGLSFFNPDRASRQLHAPLCKGCVQWNVS